MPPWATSGDGLGTTDGEATGDGLTLGEASAAAGLRLGVGFASADGVAEGFCPWHPTLTTSSTTARTIRTRGPLRNECATTGSSGGAGAAKSGERVRVVGRGD